MRLADVFLVGPVMIAGGQRLRGALGITLVMFGWLTILYNGRNWLANRET